MEDGATAGQAIRDYERITRLGLEVRTARLLMLVVLAIIVIQAVVLIVSPLFFSVNLLIGLLGLLTRQIRKRNAGSSDVDEEDAGP